ncbi:MAG TPA: N-acetylmuramoyl-L-alanine amidase [Methylomirabilota bacterium]|nr:N-acetylmuramoyl-L-alanine amidase [Methylomirabilota bacterium]
MNLSTEGGGTGGSAQAASPNHGPRPDGATVDLLILHYTGMPSGEGALRWLCDPASQVSCHYVAFEDGGIVQIVDEDRRAWHAGVSSWRGDTDINSRSIGIEMVNPGHEHGYRAFPDAQIAAVTALCADIVGRHGIQPRNVLAHSDIAPLRKEDPGELFPWAELAAVGVGHFAEPAPIRGGRFLQAGEEGEPVAALQSMLALYGYDTPLTGRFCDVTAAVVRAFQRHFRPARVDGIADVSTIETLHRLLKALPSLD